MCMRHWTYTGGSCQPIRIHGRSSTLMMKWAGLAGICRIMGLQEQFLQGRILCLLLAKMFIAVLHVARLSVC